MARERTTTESAPGAGPLGRIQRTLRDIAIVLAIIGGVGVVGGFGIFIAIPELRRFAVYTMAVGAIFLLLAVASSFVQVRSALVGRRGRYTTNAIVIIALFIAITVLISLISFLNPKRLDLTATKQFTLAPQTVKVLGELKEPVKAIAFFIPNAESQIADRQRTDDFFFEFSRRAKTKFTYRFVDPEADPSTAKLYNISNYPSIVFEGQESKRRQLIAVPPVTEQDLTSALITVTDPAKQKVVYFLTGHGEKDSADTTEGNFAFGVASRGILGDNYQIRTVNLFKEKKMPGDVALLVIAGPVRDLLTDEVPLLSDWLKNGGRAIFLMDPNPPESFTQVLAQWGVRLPAGAVVDLASSVSGDPRTILVQRGEYGSSPITTPLDATFYPLATAVSKLDEYKKDPRKQPPWVRYTPVILASPTSWVTTDPERNTFNPAKDTQGPLILGMIVEATSTIDVEPPQPSQNDTQKVTRLVIIGDSDFASNKYFHAYNNGDLLVNAVNWLAQDYSLISIRPKPTVFRQLVLTRQEFGFIRYSIWFFLPSIVALGALVAWWRRR
ncbi:MAG: hypothetical protein EXR67_00725 [Dehalococcoidia bacterium]|nr:hypothetical protein [Dehalococcoidia bacterium]